jgi:hypothetical protein
MKKRFVLIIFLAVQIVGLACLALWQNVSPSLGIGMWGTSLILLFPGNFLGGWLVEKLFWHGPLSLTAIGWLSAVLAVIINALLWFLVGRIFRLIIRTRSGAVKKPGTAGDVF